jgi:hypothetical protein
VYSSARLYAQGSVLIRNACAIQMRRNLQR